MKLLARLLLVLALLFGGALQPVRADLLSTGVGTGYSTLTCDEATTFLARTSGLDATHTAGYTTLICGLVAHGIWPLADVIYVLSTQDSTTAGLNLKSTSYTLSLVNTPTFTADRGYAGNGTTSYENTGYNPGDGGGPYNYVQNSAFMAYWPLSTGSTSNAVGFGSLTSVQQSLGLDTTSTFIGGRINSASNNLFSSNALGLITLNRSASNAAQVFYNGAQVQSSGSVSTTLVNEAYTIGRSRNAYTAAQISFALAGAALTPAQQAALYQIVCKWQVTVGAVGSC